MSNHATSPVLIGRAAEMAALRDVLDTVRRGEPAVLLVGGEAGVGKTRLVTEFSEFSRTSPARLLLASCLELGAGGLPFGPFTAMLRDLAREDGARQIAALLPGAGQTGPELARLLPELAADPGTGVPGGDPRGFGGARAAGYVGDGAADEARTRLFEEFLALLERLAEKQPLLVVVEDAHWADRSSRDLLTFFIRFLKSLRGVGIIVTFRSDELHRTHPLRPLLAELGRIDWVERIEVPRLTRGQAGELAAAILGRDPGSELAEVLYERAEGNPLFTEELLASADSGLQLPGSLADLLLRTVHRLPDDTQHVLRVASASPTATGPELLALVTGLGADALDAALRPAVTANVLVPTGDGYAFRHALIREAVYSDLLPGEPVRIHARYATAIDAAPGLVQPGRAEIEKAHHWYAARDTAGALVSAWQAAEQARKTVAHAERLMLLTRALDLWDSVPDAAARIGTDRMSVLEEAADAAASAGEYQRGLAFATAVIDNTDEAAEPVRVSRLLRQRASFKRNLGLPGSQDDDVRALRLIPDSAPAHVRTSLLLDSHTNIYDPPAPELEKMLLAALPLARDSGDHAAEARLLYRLALVRAIQGDVAFPGGEALDLIERGKSAARTARDYRQILRGAVFESHLLCGAGEYERAAGAARQGIADAERYGLARTQGSFMAINLAEPLLALGRWDEVLDLSEWALGLAPPPRTQTALWAMTGRIALARGDHATAEKMATASRPTLSGLWYVDQFHLFHALLEVDLKLAAVGPPAAVALAGDLFDRYDVRGSGSRYAWPFLVSCAAAAVAGMAGDGDGASAALLGRARALAGDLAVTGPVQEAWRLTFTAVTGASVAAWDAAAAAWEALQQPYQAACALLGAARAALPSPAAGPATGRLRRAAMLADLLGARPLSDEIADLARRARIQLADGAAPAGERGGGHPHGLTNRELEVLRLITAGQSNRQIAAALFISPKTASVHVSNILAKLGATTRAEAASMAYTRHLLG